MPFQPLDGPSTQDKVTVTTSVVKELKVGSSALDDRQVVTIQPLTGNIWVYFGNGSVPNATTVSTKGFRHLKQAKESYEVGDRQQLFIVAETGSVDVVFVERA
jgi:hypothetical protein